TRDSYRALDGMLEAVNESTVSAQTSGTVVKINVDVNDYVTANTVIIELDSTEASARLQQAKAQLVEAQSNQAATSANFQRIQQLYGQQMVSKADFDRNKAAFDSANSRLKLAEAGVVEAEKQLSYTKVVAPYSGIVKKRLIQLGETAQPGKPLMVGLSLDAQRVIFSVPQNMIENLRATKSVDVVLPNNDTVTATSLLIFPDADLQSHTFKARANLPEKIATLYPGMMVKVKVPVATRKIMQLPLSALVQRGEISAVYVRNEKNELNLRQIRVGEKTKDSFEVIAGLAENEVVMTDAQKVMSSIAGAKP
ncbi:MAG TPA: efflux RND transporter periplasmic adaptor subunit, partial [Pseudomonadales bacterium]|nr:efflux RND transporter periplasmic adaptor subunit [Pseudomonadales bacterium]